MGGRGKTALADFLQGSGPPPSKSGKYCHMLTVRREAGEVYGALAADVDAEVEDKCGRILISLAGVAFHKAGPEPPQPALDTLR